MVTFRPLVESLQRQGVRVSVVSTIRSQPPMISDELRRQADNFIELDDLRDVIGRPPREAAPDTCDMSRRHELESGSAMLRGLLPPLDLRRRNDLPLATARSDHDQTPLTLYLAAPRGFCAGVDRAIKIVEMAIEKWGAPVYVRHEIVHNKFVVDGLRDKGAVFVEELSNAPMIAPSSFRPTACPNPCPMQPPRATWSMSMPPARWSARSISRPSATPMHGLQMIMIGHEGHPETVGTMGQLPDGEVLLVETPMMWPSHGPRPSKLAYVTQTTLSVDDTADIVAALQTRFPAIVGPHKEDICYATTNRQEAVKAMAPNATRCWSSARPIRQTPNAWSRSARAQAAPMRNWCNAQMTSTGARWTGSPASASPQGHPRPRC